MRQRKYAQAFKRHQVRVARRRARIKRLIGATKFLGFYEGPIPTDGAPTRNLLATITLPDDWMAVASKAGTWTGEGVINV